MFNWPDHSSSHAIDIYYSNFMGLISIAFAFLFRVIPILSFIFIVSLLVIVVIFRLIIPPEEHRKIKRYRLHRYQVKWLFRVIKMKIDVFFSQIIFLWPATKSSRHKDYSIEVHGLNILLKIEKNGKSKYMRKPSFLNDKSMIGLVIEI